MLLLHAVFYVKGFESDPFIAAVHFGELRN